MLAYVLALAVALGSVALYLTAFIFPALHRKQDFVWSGVGLFYALVLWVCSSRITGAVLLGQAASVALLGWLGWQTLSLRSKVASSISPDAASPIPQVSAVINTVTTWVKDMEGDGIVAQAKRKVAGLFSQDSTQPSTVIAAEPTPTATASKSSMPAFMAQLLEKVLPAIALLKARLGSSTATPEPEAPAEPKEVYVRKKFRTPAAPVEPPLEEDDDDFETVDTTAEAGPITEGFAKPAEPKVEAAPLVADSSQEQPTAEKPVAEVEAVAEEPVREEPVTEVETVEPESTVVVAETIAEPEPEVAEPVVAAETVEPEPVAAVETVESEPTVVVAETVAEPESEVTEPVAAAETVELEPPVEPEPTVVAAEAVAEPEPVVAESVVEVEPVVAETEPIPKTEPVVAEPVAEIAAVEPEPMAENTESAAEPETVESEPVAEVTSVEMVESIAGIDSEAPIADSTATDPETSTSTPNQSEPESQAESAVEPSSETPPDQPASATETVTSAPSAQEPETSTPDPEVVSSTQEVRAEVDPLHERLDPKLFNQCQEATQQIIEAAQSEAANNGFAAIRPQDLLVGFLRVDHGYIGFARTAEISLPETRATIERLFAQDSSAGIVASELGLTKSARKIFDAAMSQSQAHQREALEPAQLLLTLLESSDPDLKSVLEELNANVPEMCERLQGILNSPQS